MSSWRGTRSIAVVAGLLLVTLTINLGFWQLRRADYKREIQERTDQALRDVAQSITSDTVDFTQLDGRRVSVKGRWQNELTVFIDNRTHQGVAGFHVVTPVLPEGAKTPVLVLRGWMPRNLADRSRVPALSEFSGEVVLEGIAQTQIDKSLELAAAPPPGLQDRIWQNIDFDVFRSWSGVAVPNLIVRQLAEPHTNDRLIREKPALGGDVDKHLGYATQWFAMAALAFGLTAYFGFIRKSNGSAKE